VDNSDENLARIKGIFDVEFSGSIQKKFDLKPEGNKLMKIIRTEQDVLCLKFPYHKALSDLIKTFKFHYYLREEKAWKVPHSEEVLELLNGFSRDNNWLIEYIDEWADKSVARRESGKQYFDIECPVEFVEKLKLLRCSERTQKNYCSMLKEFIYYYRDKELNSIQSPEIQSFLLHLIEVRKVSASYQNMSISAIRFYYERVLNFSNLNLERSKSPKLLPVVLSEEEVQVLLNSIENLKHRCILMTVYSGGLRLSEVVSLKVKDIDSRRKLIFIRGGKGNKDRYTLLSDSLLFWLRKYYKAEKPVDWLFEGFFGGQYSTQSVQAIMRDAVQRSGIRKHATVHTLRHSFATHLLESGVDLRYIQNLLGHNSVKTTEIYTHITTKGIKSIKSPLDRIKLD
jgi:site-specific recombinase XerD